MKDKRKGLTKYINTKEDWCPTIDNKVRVRVMLLTNKDWRVCVWGGDDFGLEKDFPSETGISIQDKAIELYNKIVDNSTKAEMRLFGMYNA